MPRFIICVILAVGSASTPQFSKGVAATIPRSMCGLAGYAGIADLDEEVLPRMCNALTHRGPDSSGSYVDEPRVAMGFRRLSIIDLEAGDQPLYNEDRSVVATCNGEIYNFQELRNELRGRGHEFRTGSDAEVLYHLYEEQGPGLLSQLRGMFSIAIWDIQRGRLLLARDRLGVKPLYWARVGQGIAYGSEPGALLAGGMVDSSPDPVAILDYLTSQYVPPPRSGFSGIRKLPPAGMLIFEDGNVKEDRYWTLEHAPGAFEGDDGEALARADELVGEATRMRLISDVPLGAFLSGGVDSSLIVSYMAEMSPHVRTFSIDFAEPRFSEGHHAERVAEIYGTDHESFTVEPDVVPLVAESIRRLGEPFADSSAIPTYLLSELTRRRVTVALSGDGGDEAFGGYDRYELASRADRLASLAGPLGRTGDKVVPNWFIRRHPRIGRAFEALALEGDERYASMMVHFTPAALRDLCTPEFLEAAGGADRSWHEMFLEPSSVLGLQRYLARDIETYLPGDLLVKVDRMSMAHSLEVRSPLLDHRVHEFAATLPARMKLRRRTSKWLLRELAQRRGLPADLVKRRKQGFGVPIGEWFRAELREWMTGILLDERTLSRGYFNEGAVRGLIDEHLDNQRDHSPRLWNLLMLELWHREWVDG